MAKPVTFKWTNEYGDEIDNTTVEDFDDYDYDQYMVELGIEE